MPRPGLERRNVICFRISSSSSSSSAEGGEERRQRLIEDEKNFARFFPTLTPLFGGSKSVTKNETENIYLH